MLLLWVDESHAGYRLTVRHRDTDLEIWTRSGLTRNRAHEVRVAFPIRFLEDGEYWLSLYGQADDRAELVAEYALRVERP